MNSDKRVLTRSRVEGPFVGASDQHTNRESRIFPVRFVAEAQLKPLRSYEFEISARALI